MPAEEFALIVFGVLLGLGLAQLLSLLLDNRHVALQYELDKSITEPGELVTLSYRVQNNGIWPLFFISLSLDFEEGLELRESEAWKQEYSIQEKFLTTVRTTVRFRLSLMPRRAVRGRIRLSAQRRGLYVLGNGALETGDFLGFSGRVRPFSFSRKLVCTAARLQDDPALQAAGGFLGELSTRRFILEDPSLVLGFRDYTGAEPMKRISWLQTARTGRLTVKNHDFTVDADVAVLVDEEDCAEEQIEHCLSMLRTVCDLLEAARIPYAVISNGDLSVMRKGAGSKHSLELQRRIGLSRFTRYRRFETIAEQCAAGELIPRGWIVIAPRADTSVQAAVARLRAAANGQLCLLSGEEARPHA